MASPVNATRPMTELERKAFEAEVEARPHDRVDALTPCAGCGGKGKVTPPSLTSEQIAKLFEMLDQADRLVGVSELKVSTAWNYRTFHDWVLLKFWGEHVLAQWTHLLLTTTPEQRQGIVEAFEAQADKLAL